MKWIYDAVYLAIFLQFARNLIEKIRAPLSFNIPIEHQANSNEYFVMVNDRAFFWSDDIDEVMKFIYSAEGMCRTLQEKLKILESDLELPLQDATWIPGLSQDEIVALNSTVEVFG